MRKALIISLSGLLFATAQAQPDGDADGVPNARDLCPNSTDSDVNAFGCPNSVQRTQQTSAPQASASAPATPPPSDVAEEVTPAVSASAPDQVPPAEPAAITGTPDESSDDISQPDTETAATTPPAEPPSTDNAMDALAADMFGADAVADSQSAQPEATPARSPQTDRPPTATAQSPAADPVDTGRDARSETAAEEDDLDSLAKDMFAIKETSAEPASSTTSPDMATATPAPTDNAVPSLDDLAADMFAYSEGSDASTRSAATPKAENSNTDPTGVPADDDAQQDQRSAPVSDQAAIDAGPDSTAVALADQHPDGRRMREAATDPGVAPAVPQSEEADPAQTASAPEPVVNEPERIVLAYAQGRLKADPVPPAPEADMSDASEQAAPEPIVLATAPIPRDKGQAAPAAKPRPRASRPTQELALSFAPGARELNPTSRQAVVLMASALTRMPRHVITIDAAAGNTELAAARARALRDLLSQHGIHRDRIKIAEPRVGDNSARLRFAPPG